MYRGYLSAPRLNKNKFAPTPVTYRERFGSLYNAYRLVGYKAVHAYRYSKAGDQVRRTHRNLAGLERAGEGPALQARPNYFTP